MRTSPCSLFSQLGSGARWVQCCPSFSRTCSRILASASIRERVWGFVFLVERMTVSGKGRVWLSVGDAHTNAEFANQAADKLRKQAFTVRVRPVIR